MFIFLLLSVSVWGQDMQVEDKSEIIQQAVDAVVADPSFAQAIVGICVMDSEGNVLAGSNQEKMLIPASNMKLFSTGAALHVLGPEYCFETTVAHDGVVEDGVLKGNLFVIGGGDPTLGSKDSIAVPLERTFAVWEKLLRDAGVRRIEGSIVGDGRYFEGPAEEPTWLWNDIGTYYGAGATGLMFYENMMSFSVAAGPEPGSAISIKPYYPETPWMEFRYSCSTGKAGTGDQLYMYTSDLAPVAEIRGTFGVDRAKKRLDCSNKFPEYTCAYHFCSYLKKKGIPCTEGPADFRLETDWDNDEQLQIIGSSLSPTLDRIIFETNHASNNLYAETLLRTLGKEMHGSACYDSSYVALNDIFRDMCLGTSKGVKIQDGSGLSRQNLISPEFMCRFLGAMTDSPHFETYLRSLPSPGGNGTLNYNMKSYPAATRNRIKAKSGSMNGIRCYSGYILPSSPDGETVIFSIMTNNCTSPTWKVRPLLDKIMGTLATYN